MKTCPSCGRRIPDHIWAAAVDKGAVLRCSACGFSHTPVESDPCSGFHGGADTSVEAFKSVSASARASIRRTIYHYIREHSGATCDEVEQALDLPHQTASARIRELAKDGLIADTGARRATRTGRKARVYEAKVPV